MALHLPQGQCPCQLLSFSSHGGYQGCSPPARADNGLIQCPPRISSAIPDHVGVLEEITGAAASPALLSLCTYVHSAVLIYSGHLTLLIVHFNIFPSPFEQVGFSHETYGVADERYSTILNANTKTQGNLMSNEVAWHKILRYTGANS